MAPIAHDRPLTQPPPIPITYTFGNHMHWVDMQWLWGYHVLPGSTRDMLRFCAETGAKGNVNFDGIGYEKLAAEAPDALAELRDAVHAGVVEVVGASYGQPYGLFHGGESNVRQRVYGVRAVMRALGVRPSTFWEEEFDFCPQLPQILSGVGYRYASLFFQWTWHTPEVPKEDVPVVWWEGIDGSRLLTATRNRLNLHQWPEDVAILMDQLAAGEVALGDNPLILQWLELMPSPDWMCRSEVLLPKTIELLRDPRFDFRFATLGEYLAGCEASSASALPRRAYTLDDVWHGMSLGKNGDSFRHYSQKAENQLLSAETLATLAGFLGRPYAQWDVYPTWELEEAWRELLQAQHHDNDECEGLCGHVGEFSYQRSLNLSEHVLRRVEERLAKAVAAGSGTVPINPLGWRRRGIFGEALPAFGFGRLEPDPSWGRRFLRIESDEATYSDEALTVRIDTRGNGVLELKGSGVAYAGKLGSVSFQHGGGRRSFDGAPASLVEAEDGELRLLQTLEVAELETAFSLSGAADGLDLEIGLRFLIPPEPGMHASAQISFELPSPEARIVTDSAYAVHEVQARNENLKKYPTGDWMTSPQWFETVRDAFTAYSLVDLVDPETGRGLLILHDRNQQWFRGQTEVRCVLNMNDPWDEAYFRESSLSFFRLIPHDRMRNSQRYKLSQEFRRGVSYARGRGDESGGQGILERFEFLRCSAENVVPTALYRESMAAGAGLSEYFPAQAGFDYPIVLRLVEFDGEATDVELELAGTVEHACLTNLMGEAIERLHVETARHRSVIRFGMRPHQIATLYLDIAEARKRTRDLDAYRDVWATIHRVE